MKFERGNSLTLYFTIMKTFLVLLNILKMSSEIANNKIFAFKAKINEPFNLENACFMTILTQKVSFKIVMQNLMCQT